MDRPNQVWCADVTYIPMRRGFLYLVAIMDWFSRKVLTWRLSNTMDADFCVTGLEEAIARFGKPEIFNTDEGSQFTSFGFTNTLKDADIRISMDGRGRWMDNVFIERLWRSLKYECVFLNAFETGSEARSGIGSLTPIGPTRPSAAEARRGLCYADKRGEIGGVINPESTLADLRASKMSKAADLVEQSVHETLTYYAFPDIHWQKIRTNNPLERIMREIRRRTRVVGAFPDGQSCLNLAAARLRYIAGTAWSTKRYMNMRPLYQPQMMQTGAVA